MVNIYVLNIGLTSTTNLTSVTVNHKIQDKKSTPITILKYIRKSAIFSMRDEH